MTFGLERIKEFFLGEKGRKALIIAGIAAMVLLLFSTLSCGGGEETAAAGESAAEFEQRLERRLESLLSEIDGAGKVTVMITLETASERVYAEDERTERSVDGKSGTQSEVVLAGSGKNPVEKSVIQPVVRGAAIVSTGAADPVVREKLAKAAAGVLDIGISRVYVTC